MSEDQVQSNEVDYTLAEKDDRLEGAEEIPLETESIPQEEIDALQHADGTWSIEDLENLSTKAPLVGESTQTDSSGTLEMIDYSFAPYASHDGFNLICVIYYITSFVMIVAMGQKGEWSLFFGMGQKGDWPLFFCLASIIMGYVCQILNIVRNKNYIDFYFMMECVLGISMIVIPVLLSISSSIKIGLLYYVINIPMTIACIVSIFNTRSVAA